MIIIVKHNMINSNVTSTEEGSSCNAEFCLYAHWLHRLSSDYILTDTKEEEPFRDKEYRRSLPL